MTNEVQQLIAKADVLIEALPYLRTFANKTFVIKYGGQAMVSEELKKSVIMDIILLKYIGINPIVVHGGGPDITRMLERLGKESHFVNGLRVTDAEDIEVVEMVLTGKVNSRLLPLLINMAAKLSACPVKTQICLVAHRRAPEQLSGSEEQVDLGYVGEITKVNPEVIHTLSKQVTYRYFFHCLGLEGESLNINADHVAGARRQPLPQKN